MYKQGEMWINGQLRPWKEEDRPGDGRVRWGRGEWRRSREKERGRGVN